MLPLHHICIIKASCLAFWIMSTIIMTVSKIIFDPLVKWRHNSDSNAGNDCSFNGFQDRLLKPLGHCATTINILYSKHFYHIIASPFYMIFFYSMVLRAGLEPARCLHQGIFLLLYVTIAIEKDVVVWTMSLPCFTV